MPIRFRCEHCQQLLGIARRKAGTRVECPTCHALVLVPFSDQEEPAAASPPLRASADGPQAPVDRPGPPGAPEEPLFERSDFDQLLQGPEPDEPSLLAPRVGRQPTQPAAPPADRLQQPPAPANIDVERVDVKPAVWPGPPPGGEMPAGYVLTPFRASVLTTGLIVLMAISFVAGLLVGRYAF
jgi:phage FluMu protein Com